MAVKRRSDLFRDVVRGVGGGSGGGGVPRRRRGRGRASAPDERKKRGREKKKKEENSRGGARKNNAIFYKAFRDQTDRPRWGRVDFIGTSVIIHRFGDFPRFRRNARCGCRKSDSRLVLCSADESRRPWPQDRKQALLRVLQQARQGFVLDDSMGDGRREEVTAVHAMHQGWYHGRSINAWPNRSLRECDPPAFAQDTNARSERLIASGRATGSRATTSCCGGDCGRPSCCTNRRRTASGRATTSRRRTASI